MKLFEAIAKTFETEGLDRIFGVMGDANLSVWGALGENRALRIYSARHEAAAVAMADGYHRATGNVGLATVTCGPGLSQTATSLLAASRSRSSLVVFTGSISMGDLHNVQIFDQGRFAEACEALYFPVRTVDTAAEQIAQAFFVARTQHRPVLIDVPMDVQNTTLEWEWDYRPSTNYLPATIREPQPNAVSALCDAFMRAERPIIVAGRGARSSEGRQAILRLAERTGALLATSLQAKGTFEGEAYNIGIAGSYSSAVAEGLFSDADFVLGVGAELGQYTSEGGFLFPEARVARIDTAPQCSMSAVPGLFVQGDAVATISATIEELERRNFSATGFRTPEIQSLLQNPEWELETANDGIDPRLAMRELSAALPGDALVTSGVGHFIGFVAMYLALPSTNDFHASLQFGSIGQTLPIALGIGSARPHRPHIVIEGDGSLLMHVQELETAVREKIPMILLVLNDCGYGAEVHKLGVKGFKPQLAQWQTPDFVAVARAFGGDGIVVSEVGQLGPALNAGLRAGGVFLIDVRISPSVVTDAYKKLHFGQPNAAPHLVYHPGGNT